jgi:hypothetical protein
MFTECRILYQASLNASSNVKRRCWLQKFRVKVKHKNRIISFFLPPFFPLATNLFAEIGNSLLQTRA